MSLESDVKSELDVHEHAPLARFLAKAFDHPKAQYAPWDYVRALALAGFVIFAAGTSIGWLHLNITKPLGNERINVRDTYAMSADERDVALLQRYLPREGKVGFLWENPMVDKYLLRLFEARLRLAPLLLDPEWRKHEWVLVDYPIKNDRALLESSSYQLIARFPDALAFARGVRIYRRIR